MVSWLRCPGEVLTPSDIQLQPDYGTRLPLHLTPAHYALPQITSHTMHIPLEVPNNPIGTGVPAIPQFANQTTLQFPTAVEMAVLVTNTHVSTTRTPSVISTELRLPSTTIPIPTASYSIVVLPSLSGLNCPNSPSDPPALLDGNDPALGDVGCAVGGGQTREQSPTHKGLLVAAILPAFIVSGGVMVFLAVYLKYRKRKEQERK